MADAKNFMASAMFWRRLDLVRYRLGWTYAALGEFVGVRNSTAHGWCRGRNMPWMVQELIPFLEDTADFFERRAGQATDVPSEYRAVLAEMAGELSKLGYVRGLTWLSMLMNQDASLTKM